MSEKPASGNLNAARYGKLPETPGVYLMKDTRGRVLYVGKAANLRRRVASYFERPHDVRIEALVRRIAKIGVRKTDTALEALILEAGLIKRLAPPFNVREKDDKSFLYIEITKEAFPRVFLARGGGGHGRGRGSAAAGGGGRSARFGPFASASSAREALRILRRIFPWSTHDPEKLGAFDRPCFDYEIGLCPGTCIGAIPRTEYAKNIMRLKLFLSGKKECVIRGIEKEMKAAAAARDFEKAEKLRRQAFALRHIHDTALISDAEMPVVPSADVASPYRIEGYDISNISGDSATGSMVVFENGVPNKGEYRRFRIRTLFRPNDVGMLTEVLERRFSRRGEDAARAWRLPNLILIDGGIAQANAARRVIRRAGLDIPIIGIVKGPDRKRNDLIGAIPGGVRKETLVRVRDEAHRFAIGYHRKLREARALQ